MIAVVVADAQSLFRDALTRVVYQDAAVSLAAEVEDWRVAMAAIHAQRPALALVARELPQPGGDGVLAAVARVTRERCRPRERKESGCESASVRLSGGGAL